ncbi:SLC4A7 [Cordylochernes scorpioides]|uniref:Anion exchange protein n=1 Tax=Cordylochernes scorpioides TaxID=51811 RepID=A0ABY6KZU2_9ARAC|nr:SLC4A7 [Cordylochernes scorpioides]
MCCTGHRARTVYVGLHMPGYVRKRHHRRHKHHHHRSNGTPGRPKKEDEEVRPGSVKKVLALNKALGVTPPAERVHFILGEEDEDGTHESHPLFSEMEELHGDGEEMEWRETARYNFSNAERCFSTDLILETMVTTGQVPSEAQEKMKFALLRRHRHQHERKHEGPRLPLIRSLAEIGKNSSKSVFSSGHGAEASNVLIGDVDFLDHTVVAFIRLAKSHHLGDLTEVPLPTKFLFILLGPQGSLGRYHEIGRAMATILSDESWSQVFHDVAYKARSRQDLLAGVDEFLDAVTVLPPGAWDPSIRIEPPRELPSQAARKKQEANNIVEIKSEQKKQEEERELQDSGLKRTGRLFGGLMDDIRRKLPWFLSDFRDAFALQSLASIFFLYFACLTPIITFGGLLGEATDNNIELMQAAMESLMAGALCGIVYGLFSGQPLTILGSTGPVLVFENILFDCCKEYELEYLPLRLWIGLWTALILFILVALDSSVLVCYITRFTEENFATLISLIFIYKSFDKVIHIARDYPPMLHTPPKMPLTCFCSPPDLDSANLTDWLGLNQTACSALNGTLTGCATAGYMPDVFFFSLILFFGTFVVSITLKDFKAASFFPTKVRQSISDFSVVIAILSMTAVDLAVGLSTPKLQVPAELKPTSPHRAWLVPWIGNNPHWIPVAAIVPALLATILIFMDQQITAVIVNRKENKLKRQSAEWRGQDEPRPKKSRILKSRNKVLLVAFLDNKGIVHHEYLPAGQTVIKEMYLSILRRLREAIRKKRPEKWTNDIAPNDFFLFPKLKAVLKGRHFDTREDIIEKSLLALKSIPKEAYKNCFVNWENAAATVLAMTHVNSLKMESECSAPGEKPKFLGVREQRVTQVAIFALVGLSVFFTPVLQLIPMPVLFGVFLYMGISSIKDSQFYDRILIILMPQKYQPDYAFLRHVPTWRVHLFTFIQTLCLLLLWAIKSYKSTSILFPLMLVVMILVRKCLECVFTRDELEILDDIMPDSAKRSQEEEEQLKLKEDNNKELGSSPGGSGNVSITLANGNILKVPVDKLQEKINITEQLSQSGLWQSIQAAHRPVVRRGTASDALSEEERHRLSTMAEEDDEEDCIAIDIDSREPLTPGAKKPIPLGKNETSV